MSGDQNLPTKIGLDAGFGTLEGDRVREIILEAKLVREVSLFGAQTEFFETTSEIFAARSSL